MFVFFLSSLIFLIPSLLFSLYGTKIWINVAKKSGLTGKDMNKPDKPEIAESGGIIVIGSFSLGLLIYIFFNIFVLKTETNLLQIFALLTSILFACILGFVDDVLGWKNGLKQWQKPLLTIPIAIPLIAINAGMSKMNIAFLGSVNLGILYPLLIIPIGIIGASNGFNMLAGINGLESGMGTIILAFMGIVTWSTGTYWLSIVSLLMAASLLGFFVFNKYPASVFPGDSMTYSVGALIAIIAILGNFEKIAVFIFLPYLIELVLKTKSYFKAESFGVVQKDGSLNPKNGKIGSLTHLLMKQGLKEKGIARTLFSIEIILCAISFLLLL